MNSHKPTKDDVAQCELSYPHDELIGPGTSSNASHALKRYSAAPNAGERISTCQSAAFGKAIGCTPKQIVN
jgi:hypothetical protein